MPHTLGMTAQAIEGSTFGPPLPRRRRNLIVLIGGLVLAAVLALLVFAWSAPRRHVALPGPDASPVQVVRAYVAAVNARDFETANEIDARHNSDLGRFSRPDRMDKLGDVSIAEGGKHVVFKADFSGGDGSIPDGRQLWGYVLERGADRRWQIVDAGVA
jgi:hypothetical protein